MSCAAPDLGEEGSRYSGKKRAVTRTAPTAERRGQSQGLPLQGKEEGSHEDCANGDLAQVANLRYRLPGISVCSTFSIQAQAVKALETIRRASFSSPSLWFTYGLSLQ